MYLKRQFDHQLEAWVVSKARKPLVVRGARQVGKTASVRNLAGTAFHNFAEFNFERQPKLIQVFEADLDPRRIVRDLEAIGETRIVPGRTLVFFDEIQMSPKAMTALRYFYEEMPDLHVIAAGSLLEFTLGTFSVPVGRISYGYLYPLSFEEFLNATDRARLSEAIPQFSLKADALNSTLSLPVYESLWSALREYFIVGGMPAAVADYSKNRSFLAVETLQNEILATYREDFTKFAHGANQLKNIDRIFARLFSFVGKQIKYTELGDGDDVRRTKASIDCLERAKIIHRVQATSGNGLPLAAHASQRRFKSIFIDIGLGQRSMGLHAKEFMEKKNLLSLYQGALAEQFVGQQILAHGVGGISAPELFYWFREEKSSTAELDYLIVRDGALVPVEVKSGPAGRLRSLHRFLSAYGGRGICLQETAEIKRVENVEFWPLFTRLVGDDSQSV